MRIKKNPLQPVAESEREKLENGGFIYIVIMNRFFA
jgi:hypothetical protein